MKTVTHHVSRFVLNSIYFIIVFVAALAISTLALTRRLNSYESTRSPLLLRVDKEEITMSNSVVGRVSKVYVKAGQHVKKGELLVELYDEAAQAKITTLEQFAKDNLSARTEASALKAQNSQFEVRSPRDAIVYKVDAVEGTSYLPLNSTLVTLFADTNIHLTGDVTIEQYADIQKQKKLDVYSSRLEQIFSVEYEGISKVLPPTGQESTKYELVFHFADSNEGNAFIQGENLEVVARTRDDSALRPSYLIAKFWNSFIIGK